MTRSCLLLSQSPTVRRQCGRMQAGKLPACHAGPAWHRCTPYADTERAYQPILARDQTKSKYSHVSQVQHVAGHVADISLLAGSDWLETKIKQRMILPPSVSFLKPTRPVVHTSFCPLHLHRHTHHFKLRVDRKPQKMSDKSYVDQAKDAASAAGMSS